MNLSELQRLPLSVLISIAQENGLEITSHMRKIDIFFAIQNVSAYDHSLARPRFNPTSSFSTPPDTNQQDQNGLIASLEDKALQGINDTQKNIITGTLKLMLDPIEDLPFSKAIKALKAISQDMLSETDIEQFIEQDIWESIKQIRDILEHPCPQNRSTNYPYFEAPSNPSFIVYNNNNYPAFEKKGLLSLTSRNDVNTRITKDEVVIYINELISERIERIENQSAKRIQFWFRNVRNENKNVPEQSHSLNFDKL